MKKKVITGLFLGIVAMIVIGFLNLFGFIDLPGSTISFLAPVIALDGGSSGGSEAGLRKKN